MPAKLFTVMLFLLVLGSIAGAEEKGPPGDEKTLIKPLDLTWEGPDQSPSEELLEFLADWQTTDGEWISPQDISELNLPENHDETITK